MNRRPLLLGLALAVAAAWSAWIVAGDDGQVVAAAARPAKTATSATPRELASNAPTLPGTAARPAPGVDEQFQLERRPAAPSHPRNLFGQYSYEAPKPKLAPTPPEAPHAPPLPFTYVGRIVIGGQTTYLLNEGSEPRALVVGANAGEFKLVQADPQRLTFLHEPTGQRVSLSLANAASH